MQNKLFTHLKPMEYVNEDGSFMIGYQKRVRPYSIRSHLHDQSYEIYYLLSGERNYFVEDRILPMQQGDLVVINRKDLHRTTDRGEPGHERLLVIFTEDFLQSDIDVQSKGLLPFVESALLRFTVEEQAVIERLLRSMLEEFIEPKGDGDLYSKLLLTQLLLYVNRHGSRVADPAETEPLQTKISEVARFIAAAPQADISLQTLSEQFFMSPYYLCRMFKKITGFSVVEYKHRVRIKEAQRLLSGSELKIIEVAAAVGYKHVGQFNRVFKQLSGLSPQQYRRSLHGQRRL